METRNDPKIAGSHRPLVWLLILALLVRGLALVTPNLWYDEANVGIMSLRVLAGDFPIFFYGQNFMGALEAYLNTLLFFFLGPTPLALETLPVLLSLLFIALSYRMIERVFGSKAAWISGLWLAVPPLFYLHWSHEARSHYPLTLVFGNLLFLLTLRLVEREAAHKKTTPLLLGLGLVSGLAWWTNYLIVAYLMPVLLAVFLLNKRAFWSPRPITIFSFFLLGSLPLRLYQWGRAIDGQGFSSPDHLLSDPPIFPGSDP